MPTEANGKCRGLLCRITDRRSMAGSAPTPRSLYQGRFRQADPLSVWLFRDSAELTVSRPFPIADWKIQLAWRNFQPLDNLPIGIVNPHSQRQFDAWLGTRIEFPKPFQHVVYIVQRRVDGRLHSRLHFG